MAILNALHLNGLHPVARPHGPGLLAPVQAMLRAVETRRLLAGLDERMLKDIGLSRADALAEAGRAPWDLGPPRR